MLNYTLYERNEAAYDFSHPFGGNNWIAQTFTPGTLHNMEQFCFYLVRVGACGAATISLYSVDSTGKPTTALLSATIAQADISETDYSFVAGLLPYRIGGTKLAIVLKTVSAGAYAGYNSVGSYTAGESWTSSDAGVTWTKQAAYDFMFQEWGKAVSVSGTYQIPIYPTSAGTHKELYNEATGYIDLGGDSIDNYQCINDDKDSPEDPTPIYPAKAVYYSLGKIFNTSRENADTIFLSGLSEGAAAYLTGTTWMWKSRVAGLFGSGTHALSQLTITDLVRSPNKNDYFSGYENRVSQVLSIEDDENVTLTEEPTVKPAGLEDGELSHYPFITPNTIASTTKLLNTTSNTTPSQVTGAKLAGTWTVSRTSDVVTGSGGNALSVYPDPTFGYNFFALGSKNDPGDVDISYSWFRKIESVDSNDQITLTRVWGGADKVSEPGECLYSTLLYKDVLASTTTATRRCSATKKDSYYVKATFNENYIYSMKITYRVGIIHYQSSAYSWLRSDASNYTFAGIPVYGILPVNDSRNFRAGMSIKVTDGTYTEEHIVRSVSGTVPHIIYTKSPLTHIFLAADKTTIKCDNAFKMTATARPFFLLGGNYSYGTQQTITADETDSIYLTKWDLNGWHIGRYYTITETIARPGGGVFTRQDLVDGLQVGIILGNLSDLKNRCAIACSQIYAEAQVSSIPIADAKVTDLQIDRVGFEVWKDVLEGGTDSFINRIGIEVFDSVDRLGIECYAPSVMSTVRPESMEVRRRGSVLFGMRRSAEVKLGPR